MTNIDEKCTPNRQNFVKSDERLWLWRLVVWTVFAFLAQHDPYLQHHVTAWFGVQAFVITPRNWQHSTRAHIVKKTHLGMLWHHPESLSDPSSFHPAVLLTGSTLTTTCLPLYCLLLASTVTTPTPWYDKLLKLVSLPLVTFLASLGQGAKAILHFRRHYADAPLPQIPCHGLVVAALSDSDAMQNTTTTTTCAALRLLVLGDSVAVGVGQSTACTPVLPETIARALATTTQRPVFWTCGGETGASTAMIVQRLQERPAYLGILGCRNDKGEPPHAPPQSQSQHTANNNNNNNTLQHFSLQQWEERLKKYQQSFEKLYLDAETWEPFDVVVLLTGANDLKSLYFPFLLAEDERDDSFRMATTGKTSLTAKDVLMSDLQAFVDDLTDKMKRGRNKLLHYSSADTIEDSLSSPAVLTVHQESESLAIQRETESESSCHDNTVSPSTMATATQPPPTTQAIDQKPKYDPLLIPESNATTLFVMPAMPTRIVPAFGQPPMSWLARMVFDGHYKKKNDFAKKQSDRVLFVEQPSKEEIRELAEQKGRIWELRRQEDILLSLQSINSSECQSIEETMKDYYNKTEILFDLPDKQGVAVYFSPDTIHPNEKGYDMWGRHIGLKIADKLEKQKQS